MWYHLALVLIPLIPYLSIWIIFAFKLLWFIEMPSKCCIFTLYLEKVFPHSTPRRHVLHNNLTWNLRTPLTIMCLRPRHVHHSLRLGLDTVLFVNALQTGAIWKRQLYVFVWTEVILKTEPLGIHEAAIIMWLPWPRFPQTKIRTLIVAF